jgi:hypothetical protein
MKKLVQILCVLAVAAISLSTLGCKKEEPAPPTANDVQNAADSAQDAAETATPD